MSRTKSTPLSAEETASFCSQMALILKSGISSIEGISIMLEDAKELNEKRLLTQIYETMMETGILYQSLLSTNVFPDYLLNMVQIGEETGRLDEVMSSLSDYYEKENHLAQTIRHALTYPFIMVFMMFVIIIILVTKVMPVFHQVFLQLGSEMTGISRIILNIGDFLNSHAIVLLCILAVLLGIFIFLIRTGTGWNLLRSLMYKFSNTKELSDQISAYRFSNGMALTLSSGLPPERCLHEAAALTENGPFRRRLDKCCRNVAEGEDLCLSLLENEIFTGIYARMSSIGSRTGTLDEVMHTIAKQYETDVDARLTRIIGRIEPTFVIILSVIVGAILLSVMLPLMGIMAAL